MRHTHFRIKNYRGIADIVLDLRATPKTGVFTLVGLNESGKTTILEALNSFSRRENLDPLDLPGYTTRDVHELIPINRRSNFNGKIEIEVGFRCEDDDERAIRQWAAKELSYTLTSNIGSFTVTQSFEFANSAVKSGQPRNTWLIRLTGKAKGERRARSLEVNETWQKLVAHIRDSRLPSVVYFPNFLFELPDRFFLEPGGVGDEKHAFYRGVLQDVLDALGEQTNINDHILARAKSGSQHDKRSMESVLLKMGSHITETVFSSWNRVFGRATSGKEIIVNIDQDENGRWFLQLRLRDGRDLYSISERSLGFRWFFAFLLLTQYRGFRKSGPRGALFLFDEPASNLHPSAQAQLLESFGRFPEHAPIIYTTHSHHMVNPHWLEGTYVVRNEGLDYDRNADEYRARETLVTLHSYRQFAAAHPNQTTYLQPILDVLAYQPSKLENVPRVVMVEGKNDFYTLKLLQKRVNSTAQLPLLPGGGAGSLTEVIRLYVGWGREFLVLLDADREGMRQQTRYRELFGALVDKRILTLADLNQDWAGKSLEDLFAADDLSALQVSVFPESKVYQKSLFNRAVQELLITGREWSVATQSMESAIEIFRRLNECMDSIA